MAYLVELTEPRVVGIRDYPVPEVGPGEVGVRTLYSGISAGTELATYRGTNPYLEKRWDPDLALFIPGATTFRYPVDVWGYSEVGVVQVLGEGVHTLQIGDVVSGIWGHRSHAAIPAQRLTGGDISAAEDSLGQAGVHTFGRSWIEEDIACDLLFPLAPERARAALEGLLPGVDVVVQGEAGRRKRLLVADMDSTMIAVECIDEVRYAGLRARWRPVTERAMRASSVEAASPRDVDCSAV